MSVLDSIKGKRFEMIATPKSKDRMPPFCILCGQRIEDEFCLKSVKADGCFFHNICGKNIGLTSPA